MKTLLFVDTDIDSLRKFNRLFKEKEYHILTADHCSTGLELLRNNHVDMVISVHGPFSQDSTGFLQRIRFEFPYAIRVIMCEKSGEKDAAEVLRKNIAGYSLVKPWEDKKLQEKIGKIFARESRRNNSSLGKLTEKIDELPTTQDRYMKILSLIHQEESIENIAEEINKDQSVAAQLLHLVNSAHYKVKTTSVKRAVSYIGLTHTLNLVLSISIIHALDQKKNRELSRLWDHAYITNRLLMFLYQNHLGKEVPEKFMPVGLLHKLGTVFFLKFYRESYLDLIIAAGKTGTSLTAKEQEAYGTTHPEVGSYLLQTWGFSPGMVDAALNHLEPMDDSVMNTELVCALHVASHYSCEMAKLRTHEAFFEEAFDSLDISRIKFEKTLSSFNLD